MGYAHAHKVATTTCRSRDYHSAPRFPTWLTKGQALEGKVESDCDSRRSGRGRSEKRKRTVVRPIPPTKGILKLLNRSQTSRHHLRCSEKLSLSECKHIFDEFYKLQSSDAQNKYLFGLIHKQAVKRKRVKDSTKRAVTYRYYLRCSQSSQLSRILRESCIYLQLTLSPAACFSRNQAACCN